MLHEAFFVLYKFHITFPHHLHHLLLLHYFLLVLYYHFYCFFLPFLLSLLLLPHFHFPFLLPPFALIVLVFLYYPEVAFHLVLVRAEAFLALLPYFAFASAFVLEYYSKNQLIYLPKLWCTADEKLP